MADMKLHKIAAAPTQKLLDVLDRNAQGIGDATSNDIAAINNVLAGRSGSDPNLLGFSGNEPRPEPRSLGGFIENIGTDTAEQAGNIAQAGLHPIDTFESLKDVAAGGMMHAVGYEPGMESGNRRSYDMAGQFGQAMGDKYGGLEELKRQAYTHPVETLMDVAGLISGGGGLLSKAPGAARAGRVIQQAGRAIDPVNVVSKGAGLAGRTGAAVLDVATGGSPEAFVQAAKTGFADPHRAPGQPVTPEMQAGSQRGEAFRGQMRETAAIDEVLPGVNKAIEKMYADRSAQYQQAMAQSDISKQTIDKQALVRSLDEIYGSDAGFYKGHKKEPSTINARRSIKEVLDEWLSDPNISTAADFDQLKQALWDVSDALDVKPRSNADRLVKSVYNKVKKSIYDEVPAYKAIMGDYHKASELLNEVEKTFGTTNKLPDQAIRRLQSIMRNNANTIYGRRKALGEKLSDNGADLLFPQLAGQQLSSLAPRGLGKIVAGQGLISGGIGAMSGAVNPASLLALSGTSPRLMGEIVHEGGRIAGTLAQPAKAVAGKLKSPRTLAEVARQSGRVYETSLRR